MSFNLSIPVHYPLVRQVLLRMEQSEDAVSELEAHIGRLPRSLSGADHWRMGLLAECSPKLAIVLVAQTQGHEFTALAFESSCVHHLLGYVTDHLPNNLDELVFFLGEDTEHAIGALLNQHALKPLLTRAGTSRESARDAAAKALEEAGYIAVLGIRPEVIDEMVELIARAGSRQYFSASIDDRSPILKRLSSKARLQLTAHELNYLLDI